MMRFEIEDYEYEAHQDVIADVIKKKCIYVPQGRMFGKAPGTRYVSQFYLSNLVMHPGMIFRIMECFQYLLKRNGIPHKEVQFCGREWSSYPLLGALNYHFPMTNTFMIRRERKNYGKHNLIEGTIINGKPCVIVDDLCNSTNAFDHCSKVLISLGVPVHDSILVVMNKKNRTEPDFLWDKYSQQKALSIVSRDMVMTDEQE